MVRRPVRPTVARYTAAARAIRAAFVQMLLVARSPPDVLLSGTEREHVASLAVNVDGLAHEPTRRSTNELVLGRQDAEVRTAERRGNTEGLPVATTTSAPSSPGEPGTGRDRWDR